MEKKIEIRAYEVRYYCDECGKEVEFAGTTTFRNPPQFEYVCCECGQTYWLEKQYPIIEYK